MKAIWSVILLLGSACFAFGVCYFIEGEVRSGVLTFVLAGGLFFSAYRQWLRSKGGV